MVDSDWLDIAIGVVFVWFLLALVVSAINEGLNRVLAIRAKHLWRSLEQMLDGNTPTSSFWGGVLGGIWEVSRWTARPADPARAALDAPEAEMSTDTTARIYATGAIQALESRPGPQQQTRISHIPNGVFAEALIEMAMRTPVPAVVGGESKAEALERSISAYIDRLHPDNPFKSELNALYASADGDLDHFRSNVESWFDGQMARLSRLYKKRIRVVLVPIGVLVTLATFAIGVRSDALALVSDLQHDRNLRSGLVGMATESASNDLLTIGCPTEEDRAALGADQCRTAGLAEHKSFNLVFSRPGIDQPTGDATVGGRLGFLVNRSHVYLVDTSHWRAWLGLLITAAALSFGATFWYDVLRRLVGLRGGAKASSA
jgi:hypothetical protein